MLCWSFSSLLSDPCSAFPYFDLFHWEVDYSFHCKFLLVKLDKEVLEDSKIEMGGGNHSFSLGHPQGKVVIPSPTLYFSVDSPSYGWYSSWPMAQVGVSGIYFIPFSFQPQDCWQSSALINLWLPYYSSLISQLCHPLFNQSPKLSFFY